MRRSPCPASTSPRHVAVPAEIPVGLPAQLLERRPDLRQLENELHAATANVGFAEASRFPYLSIGLTSFFGLVSPELARLLDGDDPAQELFSIGPFVDAPIYQSGRGTGNVEVARAQLKQAELAYRRGVLQAYREVADVLIVDGQGARLHRAERDPRRGRARGAAAAADALPRGRRELPRGARRRAAVVPAPRSSSPARSSNQLEAYVELYRALGGGWSEEELRRVIDAAAGHRRIDPASAMDA